MKVPFIAGALLLASVAMPGAAIAQDAEAESSIVVTGKHQKDWNKGSEMEAEGLKELEKARKKLIDTSADVVDAQNKRDSSAARADNAEKQFRKLIGETSAFTDARAAAAWAKEVEKSANEWARYENRNSDGRKDLDKAMKAQRSAQASVDKAQEKVDRGREMMARAERQSATAGN